MLRAAQQQGVQIVWDLCHYGWPDGLDIFSAAFVSRFARFCSAVARHVREHGDAIPVYTPINEISFFAWAAAEVGWFFPFARGRGGELKRQLVRACIAGIEAIKDVDARARITTVEPLVHVIAPRRHPEFATEAARYRESQFEACDMLAGRLAPELGGHPRYLDIVGVNFYHDNQWEHPGGEKIAWHVLPRDPRWVPFHMLIDEVYRRYERPLFVAETSHVGVGRALWLRELTDEVRLSAQGVPLQGICLYPIIDRFEWDDPTHWHNSGLWDLRLDDAGDLIRTLNRPYAAQLRRSQRDLAAVGFGQKPALRRSVPKNA
jgi:beta-glucosidase/6-phospho-beta-glucosidase/beta-galactosidase